MLGLHLAARPTSFRLRARNGPVSASSALVLVKNSIGAGITNVLHSNRIPSKVLLEFGMICLPGPSINLATDFFKPFMRPHVRTGDGISRYTHCYREHRNSFLHKLLDTDRSLLDIPGNPVSQKRTMIRFWGLLGKRFACSRGWQQSTSVVTSTVRLKSCCLGHDLV